MRRFHLLLSAVFLFPSLFSPHAETLLADATFIVFDTETTGIRATQGRIIELGAVKWSKGKIVGEKNWLINPGMPIPPNATAVHHITDDMVKDKPTFAEIYPEFLDFVGDDLLMAHNAPFDVRFMREEIKRIPGSSLPRNPVLDSLRILRHWEPGLPSYQLGALTEHYGLQMEGNFHRATDDARITLNIFLKALGNKAAADPTLETLDAAGVRRYCIATESAP